MIRTMVKYGLLLIGLFSGHSLFANLFLADKELNQQISSIVIASEPNYPPYSLVDRNGQADGFAVDLFRAAASAAGIDVQIKIGVWSIIMGDLAEGRIDALPLVGRTPEREELFDFTLPYLSLRGAIFVRKGNREIHSLEDLKHRSVVVMQGDNAEEFLRREHISEFIFTTNTFEEAFRLLDRGEYDAVLTQRITGIRLLDEMGLKSVVPLNVQLPEFRQDFCFAVQKGNTALLNRLNEGLSVIIADGTYDEIRLKWFGPEEKSGFTVADFIRYLLPVVVILIILFSLFSVLVLRKQIKSKTKHLSEEIEGHKKTMLSLEEQKALLKEREGRLRLLLDSTAEGIYGIDKNGNCTFCNEAARQMLGYSDVKQLLGKNMHELVHHSYADRTSYPEEKCPIARAFISGDRAHVDDEYFWRADKSGFPVEYWSYPVIEDGQITGSVVTFLDISVQKKMFFELRQTKEYLEKLIAHANSPIIVWSKELRIEKVNRAFERLTGISADDAVGRKADILVTPDEKNTFPVLIEKARQGERLEMVETDIQHQDGNIKTVIWSFANILGVDEKEIVATIAQGHEITARKKAENELRKLTRHLARKVAERTADLESKLAELDKSQTAMLFMVEDLNGTTAELKAEREKLEFANRELEAFSYSVSHDLRSPLRAINGFSKFLMEDHYESLDDEAKRLLNVIRENASKMDALITDLLDLSRIYRAEMKRSEVEMGSMVREVFSELTSIEKQQAFSLDMDNLPVIHCDPGLMKQVWLNLLGNAIKYSAHAETKKIVVGCRKQDDGLVFSVQDFGVGFNQKYHGKLFGVFQRLHRDNEFPGTGVGLSIVKRIIIRHGGKVWAEGKVNEGATFYFYLPEHFPGMEYIRHSIEDY
jgi:PAS domain S-box-containing protein